MADTSKAKMAPASNDEQFKFLISCIRYSNNGKVDFSEVARECSIVTKGAAAKRYERLMKAHGIHQSQSTIRDIPVSSRPKASPSTPSKKRKTMADSDDAQYGADGGDDDTPSVKKAPTRTKVKKEATATDGANDVANTTEEIITIKDDPENAVMKEEPITTEDSTMYEDLQVPAMGLQTDGADDNNIFNNFIDPGAFGPCLSVGQISLNGAFDPSAFMATSSAPQNGNGGVVRESIVIAD